MAKKLKITTIEKVNVREDAGITFARIGSIPAWKTLEVKDAKPDAEGITWYEIDGGWICSKYCDVGVTHPRKTTAKSTVDPKTMPTPVSPGSNGPVTNTKSTVLDSLGSLGTSLGNGISGILDGFLGGTIGASDYAFLRRRIFGAPYQFLPATDIRPDAGGTGANLGRIYTANILSEAPILSLMPCKPRYLPGLPQEEKDKIMEQLIETATNATTDLMKAAGEDLMNGVNTRYYGTDTSHTEYMKYVNLMCRGASLFMGIGDQLVPGTTIAYKYYDWTNWRMSNIIDNSGIGGAAGDIMTSINNGNVAEAFGKASEAASGAAVQSIGDIPTDVGDVFEKFSTENYFVDFYITPSTSYSESFTNRTEKSAFEGIMNKGSDMLKEILFVLGPDGLNNESVRQSVAKATKEGADAIAKISGNDQNLFSRLLGDAQTIISGSNIIFPEIWHESDFSKSYRAEIKLVSPYGSREAIFLNLLVPMFHAIAFVLPRQTGVNSYGAPFLIKGHSNKWFNIEMGIVDSVEITKDDWNADGFPGSLTISMSFKDLYSALSMPKFDDPKAAVLMALNQSFIEYLSVNCGLNMKRSEWKIKMDLLDILAQNMVADLVPTKTAEMREKIGNSIGGIFGGVV